MKKHKSVRTPEDTLFKDKGIYKSINSQKRNVLISPHIPKLR